MTYELIWRQDGRTQQVTVATADEARLRFAELVASGAEIVQVWISQDGRQLTLGMFCEDGFALPLVT